MAPGGAETNTGALSILRIIIYRMRELEAGHLDATFKLPITFEMGNIILIRNY